MKCVERSYEKQWKRKTEDGKLNTDLSFDGTWLTRGHKCHIGATFIMNIYSGMVEDFEILSNFCRACAIIKKKKEKAQFDEWHMTVHTGKCQANFQGLSGAMESEGAVRMWQRSEGKGFRYVTFLSDRVPSRLYAA